VRDQQRFEALHASTGERLLRYFLRRIDDPGDAADLVAETYLVLWRRIGRLPGNEDGARAWAFGVAAGVLRNHRRGVRRRLALADRLRDSLTETTQPDSPSTSSGLIRAALEHLSEEDQELVTLIAWDGLSPTKAAQALGIEPGAARVRLHRARRRLRAALGAEDGPEPPQPSAVACSAAVPLP
jgi:RNA polymerase sigma factor (sigma-70 family)